jgi:hypothetical protein
MKATAAAIAALALALLARTPCAEPASVNAAGEELTAEGTGMGTNKDEALMAAKRDAIEKGIGMVLLSQTEIQNFMVQRDMVVTKTIGAVKSYEVVSETRTPDNLFEEKIKAVLSRSAMREDLAAFKILIESMDKPRVMVIVNENNVGNAEPTNQASETAIVQFLRDPYEFDVVDPQVVAQLKQQQKVSSVDADAAAAAKIGVKYGAEVIITGSAVARTAEGLSQNLGGMVSVQADVTLKAINCTTGRVIGSASAHAAKVHLSPNTAGTQAIAKASDTAVKSLLDVIIKEWQNQLNNGTAITLNVKGVTSFRLKSAIVSTIGGIAGVGAVHERAWDAESSTLEIDVSYKGNVNGFCTHVDGFKFKSGSGSFAVSGVNGNAVTLTVQAM